MWRLTWDAISVLAVIWAVEVEPVLVLPILDTVDADEWSALLDRDVTGGLGQLAVSVALETPVPWSVLDARVSRLAETDMLSTLRAAFRSGAPSDTPRGEVVRSPLDERLVNVELVAESLHELANAVWAPLPALATAVDLDFDVLTDAGVAVNRALAIVRGASPTDDEVEVIDAATGRRPGIPPVDDELRRKIDQPRRKAAIRVRARANSRWRGGRTTGARTPSAAGVGGRPRHSRRPPGLRHHPRQAPQWLMPSALAKMLCDKLTVDELEILREDPFEAIPLIEPAISIDLVSYEPGEGCSVEGLYHESSRSITVQQAASRRRTCFTAIHEFGHDRARHDKDVAVISPLRASPRAARPKSESLMPLQRPCLSPTSLSTTSSTTGRPPRIISSNSSTAATSPEAERRAV